MVRRRHQPKKFLGTILVICAGLVFCMIAFVGYVNIRISLQQRPAMGQGQIVSCHMESVQETETLFEDECRPTVRFQTASSQGIVFVSSYPWGGFHPGDNVSVQYKPERPQDALIVSDGLWMEVWMIGAFCGLPLIVGGIYWWGYVLLRKRLPGRP